MLKKVVVVLPYVENRILMQLRDAKDSIVFPACWGFFGGSIDDGETAGETARRELLEELMYEPEEMLPLDIRPVSDFGNLVSHSYYCSLTLPLERIALKEGMDCGLFSLEEVQSKKLYSKKFQRFFPVIASNYIEETIQKLLKRL